MTTIQSHTPTRAPAWAVLERQLFDAMDQAAPLFIDQYTRPGGSLIWTESYPGDGVWADDLYEAFFNWPVFYALGGSAYTGEKAVQQWNALTRQITYDYGRASKEFINDDDWFHNSENYIYFYALGLSDPTNAEMMRRARRFAGFYMAEDPEVPNYDPAHKIIRSPFSGSKGPLFHARFDDVHYNLEHGHTTLGPGFELPQNWFADEATRAQIHAKFDEVVMNGDVPVNLGVVPMVAHAYLLTHEDKYRDWVVEYVEAWMERIQQNHGIIPDNVGPNGIIGENRQGEWWGGFYGWAATYSQQMMGSAMTVAAESAYLITGEARYLDLIRSQLDMLLEHAREENGQLQIPHRYKDGDGWTDYGPPRTQESVHLWAASMDLQDWERLEKLRQGDDHDWASVSAHGPRGEDDRAWISYLAGDCPDYPEAILQANYEEIRRRVQAIQEDEADLTKVDEHHWQQRNPVVPEALVQLTTGGPQAIYWGGLSRGRLRHFDVQQQRPGLPQDVAALVSRLDADSVDLKLVNLSVHAARELIVQAGTYGEHQFGRIDIQGADTPIEVNDKTFQVQLRPGTEIDLHIHMQLYKNRPGGAFPWHGGQIPFR
jgi:hypothetical protein